MVDNPAGPGYPSRMNQLAEDLIAINSDLSADLGKLEFAPPVHTVYNPLEYADAVFHEYLRRYAQPNPAALFMGMNPGPWGMAQTGIPFGAVPYVRDWMSLGNMPVGKPPFEHKKRPVEGFDCSRVEVSGDRLWGLMSGRYPDPRDFFADHLVINYCPLVFMEEGGRNRTPDKLPASEQNSVLSLCDGALVKQIRALKPKTLIGVGKFAEKRLSAVARMGKLDIPVYSILHPSPASPAANRGWAEQAESRLIEIGIWRR